MVVLNKFPPLGFGSSVIGGWDKNMHSGFAKIVLPVVAQFLFVVAYHKICMW